MKCITDGRASRFMLMLTLLVGVQMIVMIGDDHPFVLAPVSNWDDRNASHQQVSHQQVKQEQQEQVPLVEPAKTAFDYKRELVVEPEVIKPKEVVVTASAETTEQHLSVISEQYEAIEVIATGYYAGPESTGKGPDHPEYGITYSGLKVLRNSGAVSTIAADINVFPLGTLMYIPGYGYGVVADIGSAVKGNVIDLYFDTIEDVYSEWGKKVLDVFIIQYGEGKITSDMFEQLSDTYKQ